jgi:hypothetical protein
MTAMAQAAAAGTIVGIMMPTPSRQASPVFRLRAPTLRTRRHAYAHPDADSMNIASAHASITYSPVERQAEAHLTLLMQRCLDVS